MSTPDELNDWHDLLDQLTPEHIRILRCVELAAHGFGMRQEKLRVEMLRRAREFASLSVGNLLFPQIAHPAGAATVHAWCFESDGWQRRFEMKSRTVEGFTVQICGAQREDGSTTYQLRISGACELEAGQAQQLGAAIVAEVDKLTC